MHGRTLLNNYMVEWANNVWGGGFGFRQGWSEGVEEGAEAESWINCIEGHAGDIIYNVPHCNIYTSTHNCVI